MLIHQSYFLLNFFKMFAVAIACDAAAVAVVMPLSCSRDTNLCENINTDENKKKMVSCFVSIKIRPSNKCFVFEQRGSHG